MTSTYDPLVEPRIILSLGERLRAKGGSVHYRVKGVGAPNFDTDMDLLEIKEGSSFAYEIKGVRQRTRGRGRKEKFLTGPRTLEGADQALIHLCYADYSYLIHPQTTFIGYLLRSKILTEIIGIGYIIATSNGKFIELVPPRKSPIDVVTTFGHKRLVEVEPYDFAETKPWDIKRELDKMLGRYKGLPLDFSEEDQKNIEAILREGKEL